MARIAAFSGRRERLLDGGWTLAVTPAGACVGPAEAAALSDWIAAPVPGTAAQALETAGRWSRLRPEPLHDKDVWYRLSLPEAGRRTLCFDGLATFAEAWLDEASLIVSSSMFEPCQAQAEIPQGATLWLCFRALAPRLAAAKGPRARWRPRMIEHQGLRLVRTTPLGHMPGWRPSVDVVGPWRPIRLIEEGRVKISGVRLRPSLGQDGAQLWASVAVEGCDEAPVLHCAGVSAELEPQGEGRFGGTLRAPNAAPWMPHTHGEPALHTVSLTVAGETVDLGRTGFRRLELDRGVDGKGFGLRVNGEPVFCRGACWVNPDAVALAGDRAAYEPALRLAREAGMNMVRIAGVGVYESPAFFEICDELGILVWQDFMFANFDYPGADPAFAEIVRREAEAQLEPTEASPSLAVLCGGSEVMQQAAMMGLAPASLAWPLFDEVLAGAAETLRPDVVYAPNTPFGGPMPFCAEQGVTHYYGAGAYERPIGDVRRANVRFAAECLAFANVPGPKTLAAALPVPAVHDPRWKARTPRDRGASWDFEDVRDHYLEALFGHDARRLRREDPDLYLDLSRAVTGEVMAATFAEWRRAGSSCAGGLVWMLGDAEAGAGWGLIDALGAPKPAWHALRRVLQPVQVLVTDEGVNGLTVHVLNERLHPLEVELRLSVHAERGGPLIEARRPLSLGPRQTLALSAFELVGRFFDIGYAYRFGPRAHAAASVQLIGGAGELLSEALFLPPGERGFGDGEVAAELAPSDGGTWRLTLSADRLQRFVRIEDPAFAAEDDWLTLLPGEPRTVRLSPRSPGQGAPEGEILGPGGRVLGGYRVA